MYQKVIAELLELIIPVFIFSHKTKLAIPSKLQNASAKVSRNSRKSFAEKNLLGFRGQVRVYQILKPHYIQSQYSQPKKNWSSRIPSLKSLVLSQRFKVLLLTLGWSNICSSYRSTVPSTEKRRQASKIQIF